jgi:DNA-binding transcriptional ArsR family regulator
LSLSQRPPTPPPLSLSQIEGTQMGAIVSKEIEAELSDSTERSPRLDQLMRNARLASDFLKALSHENRLLLLCLLAEKERSVSELENLLAMSQSSVSQQLARLRYDNLVTTRRDGKAIFYSIANENVRSVIALIYDIFCEGEEKPRA